MLRTMMSISGAGFGGCVELVDQPCVVESVDLDQDRGLVVAFRAAAATSLDLADEPVAQVERRDEQLAELLRLAESCQVVEEVGDIRRDLLIRGEEPEVLVDPRVDRVVVAGADVRIAPKPVRVTPDDERRLRVDLHVRESVDDVHSRLLEPLRPVDVPILLEAGLELDEADGLLSRLRRRDESRHESRVVARAVHGRLEPDHLRVA